MQEGRRLRRYVRTKFSEVSTFNSDVSITIRHYVTQLPLPVTQCCLKTQLPNHGQSSMLWTVARITQTLPEAGHHLSLRRRVCLSFLLSVQVCM